MVFTSHGVVTEPGGLLFVVATASARRVSCFVIGVHHGCLQKTDLCFFS